MCSTGACVTCITDPWVVGGEAGLEGVAVPDFSRKGVHDYGCRRDSASELRDMVGGGSSF